MLPNPFPDHISFCLLPIHSTSNQKLHPAEENYFSQLSSVSRKEHYRSGRICAGEVLSKLGTLGQPVLRDPQTREPLWPEGISGAITHSGNWAAAAAGKTRELFECSRRPSQFRGTPDCNESAAFAQLRPGCSLSLRVLQNFDRPPIAKILDDPCMANATWYV